MILHCSNGDESQATQDEEMSSGTPALDQTASSMCHESKGFTINNDPESKDKGSNNKKKEKDKKVIYNKVNDKESRKRKYSTTGSSSSSEYSRSEYKGSSSDSLEEEDSDNEYRRFSTKAVKKNKWKLSKYMKIYSNTYQTRIWKKQY